MLIDIGVFFSTFMADSLGLKNNIKYKKYNFQNHNSEKPSESNFGSEHHLCHSLVHSVELLWINDKS